MPPALSINPELPPVIDDILSQAMARLPEDRYQSVAEMGTAIEVVMGSGWQVAGGKWPVAGEADEWNQNASVDTAVPTAEVAESGALSPIGSLRFADPDRNNLRQYTLSLNDVPAPPAGFHYKLWFDFANESAPENVAEVTVQNGRVTYADVLVENLATTVTNVHISLEPDFDDDPTISDDVLFTGTVKAESGLAEIDIFGILP